MFDTGKEPMNTKTDEELLALCIAHPSCFAVLVDRYQSAFLRKAEQVMKNKEDAQDIVQETFTKIYMHASAFHRVDGASFRSWAYKILLNTAFTHYQRMKKRNNASVVLEPEAYKELSDSGPLHVNETADYVASVLSRLPESLGRILSLHFLEDKPHKEIADIEGISVSAVKTRVHRAKKEFKRIEPNLVL